MKPILILQNASNDGPDYFEAYLQSTATAYHVVNIGQGQALPLSLHAYGGFALMGGAMGANDESLYPHLTQAYALLQQAIAERIPVIGHCLGGQMLAKALGASVTTRPNQKEVGWHEVTSLDSELALEWLGAAKFQTMQWHYDVFSLPQGASLLASSRLCPHQAFVAHDIFLGMQFHIEARGQKINIWVDEVRSDASEPDGIHCHDDARIRFDTEQFAAQARTVADHIYGRWLNRVRASQPEIHQAVPSLASTSA